MFKGKYMYEAEIEFTEGLGGFKPKNLPQGRYGFFMEQYNSI